MSEFPQVHFSETKQISDYIAQLGRPQATISFCGTFKSGKSSLLNALLGANILPTRAISATAVITKVFYAQQPHVYAVLENGGIVSKQDISFEQIAEYVLPAKRTYDNAGKVKEVCIGIPNEFLRSGIILIDTPGLDDEAELSEITFNAIHETDLAVFVYDASRFSSMNEKAAITRIEALLGGNIIFVVNKTDMVDSLEDIKELAALFMENSGNELVGSPTILYTKIPNGIPQIQSLVDALGIIVAGGLIKRIALHSRLHILLHKINEALNQQLNKREEHRLAYSRMEQNINKKELAAVASMHSKMMQLCMRINNVRYKIDDYITPFSNMCISIAREENLLTRAGFDSSKLVYCIEQITIAFAAEFSKKLKLLYREFSVDFSSDISQECVVTAGKLNTLLAKLNGAENGILGTLAVNMFGESMFNQVSHFLGAESQHCYTTAYLMAVEEQTHAIRQQIYHTFDLAEQRALNDSKSYTPDVNVPQELKPLHSTISDSDEIILWYRECLKIAKSML